MSQPKTPLQRQLRSDVIEAIDRVKFAQSTLSDTLSMLQSTLDTIASSEYLVGEDAIVEQRQHTSKMLKRLIDNE